MFEPVKVAFGQFMAGFYESLVPTTQPMSEYVTRGLEKSIAWAPTRMVDSVEEMLASWQRADTDNAPTRPVKAPVIFVAMARDLTGTGRDYTRQVADPVDVVIPGDTKERYFKLRTVAGDIRAQIAICANDEPTSRSIAAQFGLWLDSTANRRMLASHSFASIETNWPVQIEDPGIIAMDIKTDAKNLSILAIDITLKATIPLFQAPKEGEANDGKGSGTAEDPHGYPVVTEVASKWCEVNSWRITK